MSAAVADRRASSCALVFGLATLGVFVAFTVLTPVRDAIASGCATTETPMRFQLARSMDDLTAVFSAPGGACRAPIIAAVDAVNTLDLYAFIPVYAAFLIAAAITMAGPWRTRIALAAIGAVVVAALGDALETSTQLRITRDIEGAVDQLAPLALGYWVKNGGIGIYAALVAGIALGPPRRRFLVAAFAVIAALAMVGAAFDPRRAPVMTICYGLFWLALLAMAVHSLLRPIAKPVRGDAPA